MNPVALSDASPVTPDLVRLMVSAAKQFDFAPIRCRQCNQDFYVVSWTKRPAFPTPGVLIVTSETELEDLARIYAQNKFDCSYHSKLDGDGKPSGHS